MADHHGEGYLVAMLGEGLLRRCLQVAPGARPHMPVGDTVDVLVNRQRQLGALDLDRREMFVSVGAAVLNLRLAIRSHGYDPQVHLMPDRADPDLAARVSIDGPAAPPASVLALYEAIARRHTNRRPFADRPVPDILTEPSMEHTVRPRTSGHVP